MADEPVDPTAAATPQAEPAATVPGADMPSADMPLPPPPPAEEVVEAELVEVPEAPVTEPVEAPVAAEAGVAPQYVVVEAPRLPRRHGNRGVGTLLALLGAVVYGLLLLGATYLDSAVSGVGGLGILQNYKFYVPIVVFAIALILVVLVVNRAAWWAYVLGGLLVGLAVYFGTAGGVAGIDLLEVQLGWTTTDRTTSFDEGLSTPFVIIAAVIAHEVAIWWGAIIAHRGRRMTAKNRLAREAFDEQLAEFHAKYGRTAA